MELEIGKQLRQIRKKRGLSLEELAGCTGVSKPMLSSIERGASTPTITILWKIATGLKIPLSSLLKTKAASYTLTTIRDTEPIRECEGKMRAWTVQEFDPIHTLESFLIELDPDSVHVSEAHNPGVEEMILVQEGEMEMVLGEDVIPVRAGQVLKFKADIEHAYRNPGGERCVFCDQMIYGGE